jgi:uncharacterized protein YqiB (DUF1249 family)
MRFVLCVLLVALPPSFALRLLHDARLAPVCICLSTLWTPRCPRYGLHDCRGAFGAAILRKFL